MGSFRSSGKALPFRKKRHPPNGRLPPHDSGGLCAARMPRLKCSPAIVCPAQRKSSRLRFRQVPWTLCRTNDACGLHRRKRRIRFVASPPGAGAGRISRNDGRRHVFLRCVVVLKT